MVFSGNATDPRCNFLKSHIQSCVNLMGWHSLYKISRSHIIPIRERNTYFLEQLRQQLHVWSGSTLSEPHLCCHGPGLISRNKMLLKYSQNLKSCCTLLFQQLSSVSAYEKIIYWPPPPARISSDTCPHQSGTNICCSLLFQEGKKTFQSLHKLSGLVNKLPRTELQEHLKPGL